MHSGFYVPVMNTMLYKYRKQYAEKFDMLSDAQIVVCIERTFDPVKEKRNLEILKDNLKALENKGYTPFVWMQAFGFGIGLTQEEATLSSDFERITDFDGRVLEDAMCPLGEKFLSYYKGLVQGVIEAGAKRIMLDDDLCLSVRPGLGCSCDKHMNKLSERMNTAVTREMLKKELFKGGESELRSEWLSLMGDTLIDFCRKVRSFADEIDPDVSIGFCAGYTSWDIEGADALTLTRTLAGKNQPFLRLTGAPYWIEQRRFEGQTMAQIIEFTRMQRVWCTHSGVEIFTENDSYPRPRYRVPAAVMETFDFMMAADSGIGQLKYLFEYYSSPDYEKGYLAHHLRNRDKRNFVKDRIGHMPSKGIYVHEEMRKVQKMSFPDTQPQANAVMLTAFSHAAGLLSSCAVPTTYEFSEGAAIAFGDSGRTIAPERHKGLILDYTAARELMKRGYDVGIKTGKEAKIPFTERFIENNDQVLLDGCVYSDVYRGSNAFYACELDQKAIIESVFPYEKEEIPASYRYENEAGQKFLVFLFRGDKVKSNSGLSCSYYRAGQIQNAVEWMDKQLPVRISGHPGMYTIVKEDDEAFAFAYANFSLDPAYDVLFELDASDKDVEWIGCNGKKAENGIIIDCIHPWSTGAVILKK